MNHKQITPTPDENQLIDRLERIQPQPSADFHRRMETMPWRTQPVTKHARTRRLMTAFAATITLLIVGTLTITPLRSLAQDLWDSFFERADSNEQPYNTPVIPAQFTPTPVYTPQPITPMTIDDAREIVPFEFKVPNLGEQYRLIEVGYLPDESQFMLLYARSGMLLGIIQTPLEDAQPERIGPNAAIQRVQVGDYTAEYAEGYWDSEMGEVEGQVAIEGEAWVDTPNVWRMSWTDGTLFYRLGNVSAQGWYDNIFSLDEIVAIAESLETGALVDDYDAPPLFTPTPVQ